MKRKILVPHDGYEMSDKALRHAVEVARKMSMEIIILRVVPEFFDGSSVLFLSAKERRRIKKELSQVNRQIQVQISSRLTKQLKICISAGLKARRMVVIGDPVEKILSVARKEDPYLIVMGSRRLKGLRRLKALGGVARRISEEAKCPVTIVH